LSWLYVATYLNHDRETLLAPDVCSVLVTIAANSNVDGVSDKQMWGVIVNPEPLNNPDDRLYNAQ
jgi:hypothetical protein